MLKEQINHSPTHLSSSPNLPMVFFPLDKDIEEMLLLLKERWNQFMSSFSSGNSRFIQCKARKSSLMVTCRSSCIQIELYPFASFHREDHSFCWYGYEQSDLEYYSFVPQATPLCQITVGPRRCRPGHRRLDNVGKLIIKESANSLGVLITQLSHV